MARSLTYVGMTAFDSDGDGILDRSAPGTVTKEFDDQGNLVHDLSTIDPNGDGTPDFRESRFTYDANNNVATQVTEIHGTEGFSVRAISHAYDGLGKLVTLATDLDRGADGVIDSRTREQFTYDEQGRQITHTVETDAGADGSVNETSVYTNTYSGQGALIVGATDADANGTIDSRSTAQNTYDQNNHLLTSIVDSDNNADGKIDYHEIVNNTYDAHGNSATELQQIDRDANGVVDFRYAASHTYDAQGELTSSEFHYDFNGDGIDDLQTSQKLVVDEPVTPPPPPPPPDEPVTPPPPPPPPDEPVTPPPVTENGGVEKLPLPDWIGLTERDQDGNGISESDLDRDDDGDVDSDDSPLYDEADRATLVEILNHPDYPTIPADQQNKLVALKKLLDEHPLPYPDPAAPVPVTESSTGDDTVAGDVDMQAQSFENAQSADIPPPEENLTPSHDDFLLI
jgi:hypothetical protein